MAVKPITTAALLLLMGGVSGCEGEKEKIVTKESSSVVTTSTRTIQVPERPFSFSINQQPKTGSTRYSFNFRSEGTAPEGMIAPRYKLAAFIDSTSLEEVIMEETRDGQRVEVAKMDQHWRELINQEFEYVVLPLIRGGLVPAAPKNSPLSQLFTKFYSNEILNFPAEVQKKETARFLAQLQRLESRVNRFGTALFFSDWKEPFQAKATFSVSGQQPRYIAFLESWGEFVEDARTKLHTPFIPRATLYLHELTRKIVPSESITVDPALLSPLAVDTVSNATPKEAAPTKTILNQHMIYAGSLPNIICSIERLRRVRRLDDILMLARGMDRPYMVKQVRELQQLLTPTTDAKYEPKFVDESRFSLSISTHKGRAAPLFFRHTGTRWYLQPQNLQDKMRLPPIKNSVYRPNFDVGSSDDVLTSYLDALLSRDPTMTFYSTITSQLDKPTRYGSWDCQGKGPRLNAVRYIKSAHPSSTSTNPRFTVEFFEADGTRTNHIVTLRRYHDRWLIHEMK